MRYEKCEDKWILFCGFPGSAREFLKKNAKTGDFLNPGINGYT
jgi:hypothetical protein